MNQTVHQELTFAVGHLEVTCLLNSALVQIFNIFSLFAGDEAASTRQRRLKHRRMVKRLAKDGLASSNRTKDEGNSHID